MSINTYQCQPLSINRHQIESIPQQSNQFHSFGCRYFIDINSGLAATRRLIAGRRWHPTTFRRHHSALPCAAAGAAVCCHAPQAVLPCAGGRGSRTRYCVLDAELCRSDCSTMSTRGGPHATENREEHIQKRKRLAFPLDQMLDCC